LNVVAILIKKITILPIWRTS